MIASPYDVVPENHIWRRTAAVEGAAANTKNMAITAKTLISLLRLILLTPSPEAMLRPTDSVDPWSQVRWGPNDPGTTGIRTPVRVPRQGPSPSMMGSRATIGPSEARGPTPTAPTATT